jgi:hypothetical protein
MPAPRGFLVLSPRGRPVEGAGTALQSLPRQRGRSRRNRERSRKVWNDDETAEQSGGVLSGPVGSAASSRSRDRRNRCPTSFMWVSRSTAKQAADPLTEMFAASTASASGTCEFVIDLVRADPPEFRSSMSWNVGLCAGFRTPATAKARTRPTVHRGGYLLIGVKRTEMLRCGNACN